MRLGKVQSAIIKELKSRRSAGLMIWEDSEIPGIEGYYVEDILPAVERLIARGIVRRVGDNGRIVLVESQS